MDKLTLEHLAPYLPYGIELAFLLRDEIRYVGKITSLVDIQEYDDIKIKIGYNDAEHIWMFKPIFRPLSDLTKEIEHNGERFVPIHRILEAYCFDVSKMTENEILGYVESLIEIDISYITVKILCELHFDFQDLIAAGLAVDINTLEGGLSHDT